MPFEVYHVRIATGSRVTDRDGRGLRVRTSCHCPFSVPTAQSRVRAHPRPYTSMPRGTSVPVAGVRSEISLLVRARADYDAPDSARPATRFNGSVSLATAQMPALRNACGACVNLILHSITTFLFFGARHGTPQRCLIEPCRRC